jgi:hypothetical protein
MLKNRELKIRSHGETPYILQLEIVSKYLKENKEESILPETTGKFPEIIKLDRNYRVTCKGTKTTYTFEIWRGLD